MTFCEPITFVFIDSNGLYSTIDFSTKDEMTIIEGKSFNVCHIRDNGIGVTVVPVKPTAKVFKSINLKKFKKTRIERYKFAHMYSMIGVYVGALLIAGAFTLMPGRFFHEILFG